MTYDFEEEMRAAVTRRQGRISAESRRIRRAAWSGAWCGFVLSMAGIAAIRAYDVMVHPEMVNRHQGISASCEQGHDDLPGLVLDTSATIL